MKTELERLIEDRDEAEAVLEILEDELRAIERANPDNYEDAEGWEAAHHALNEELNNVDYLNACIESYED